MSELEKSMQELKDGNLNALEYIYKEASKGVYLLAYSILRNAESAKDIMQNTFIQAAKSINKYKNDTSPLAWISTIARNLSYREYTNARRNISLEVFGESTSVGQNTLESFISGELINSAMKILEVNEREIVMLFAVEGYKHREIAKIVNKPMGTVQWLYARAIKKLRKYVDGEGGGHDK